MRRNADLPWIDQHSRRCPFRVTRGERSRMQNSRIGAGYWVKSFGPASECSGGCVTNENDRDLSGFRLIGRPIAAIAIRKAAV